MGGVGAPAGRKAAGAPAGLVPIRASVCADRARGERDEGRRVTEAAEVERPHGSNRAAHRFMRLIPPMYLGRRDVTTTLPRLTRVRHPRTFRRRRPGRRGAARTCVTADQNLNYLRFQRFRSLGLIHCDSSRFGSDGRSPPTGHRSGRLIREGCALLDGRWRRPIRRTIRGDGPAAPARDSSDGSHLPPLLATPALAREALANAGQPRPSKYIRGIHCQRDVRTLRSLCRHTSDDCPRGGNRREPSSSGHRRPGPAVGLAPDQSRMTRKLPSETATSRLPR